MDLDNKVVLITGGSSGIGKAAAGKLLECGANVVICGRNVERLESVILELKPSPERFHAVQADITKRDEVDALIASSLRKFSHIDVLVNSAGRGYLGSFLETSDDLINSLMEVNVQGAMRVTRAVLPSMMEQKSGLIINMCGILGVKTIANAAVYCATKHALLGFGNALAQEVRRSSIRVTNLCCSGVDTPFWDTIPGKPRPEMLLTADDVANEIVHIVGAPPHTIKNQVLLQHTAHQL